MNHEEALDAICGVQGITVLSYQEAVEGYMKLRGIPLASTPPPAADEARMLALVRTGCRAADVHLDCSYPTCGCSQMPTAIKAVLQTLSRIPSEEATEELLSEETVQACIVELFDLKSNVVRVNGPKKGSVTTETLVRTVLNAAAKRITRAPGAVV